jgi:hypothetical protein
VVSELDLLTRTSRSGVRLGSSRARELGSRDEVIRSSTGQNIPGNYSVTPLTTGDNDKMYLIRFPDNTHGTNALRYSGTKESRTQAVRIARFHNSILGLALHRSWPTLPSVRSPILSVPRTGLLSSLRQPCEPFHLLPLSPSRIISYRPAKTRRNDIRPAVPEAISPVHDLFHCSFTRSPLQRFYLGSHILPGSLDYDRGLCFSRPVIRMALG